LYKVGIKQSEFTPVEHALVGDRISQLVPKKPSFVEAGIPTL